jgi:hypothetical protein
MNPIKLILLLLRKFVPMETTEFKEIATDANFWYSTIDDDNDSKHVMKPAFEFLSSWYAKIGLSVLYFVLLREIHRWFHDVDEELREDMKNEDYVL